MKLSAIIITRNEEESIGRCLGSLQGIADETIVIDSLSDDNTEKISRQYGVQFISREFQGYSDTKNYGISLAQNDWILSLDADEALSEELRNSILMAMKDPEADGYFVNRRTSYCGQWIYHCGWYPDRKLRLWKKNLGKWEGHIHEKVVVHSKKVSVLKGDLLHYSYPSISSHLSQINTFTDYMASDLYKKRKKASALKLIFSPLFKFFKKFILQKGFLDGYYGFVICTLSMYYTFSKYAKLRELWKASPDMKNAKDKA